MLAALDIETKCNVGCTSRCEHALFPDKSVISIIGVWCEEFAATFNVEEFKKFLVENPQFKYVLHNGKFDFKHLRYHGVDLNTVSWAHDTQLMASTCLTKIPETWLKQYEERRKIENKKLPHGYSHREAKGGSLKTLAPYFLGVEPFWEDPSNHANEEYVLKDCEYTYRLCQIMLQKMAQDGTIRFYEDKLLKWTKDLLLPAEEIGITIDTTRLKRKEFVANRRQTTLKKKLNLLWAEAFSAYEEKEKEKLKNEYEMMAHEAVYRLKTPTAERIAATRERYKGLYEKAVLRSDFVFNINSDDQMLWLLRDYFKLNTKVRVRDKVTNVITEKDSTGVEVLNRLADEGREDIKLLLEYREYNKLASAFYPSYRELIRNGKIHTTFNVTGTRTGRLSSSDPNCLSLDTEILTDSGFKNYQELESSDLVAQFLPTTGTIEFVRPDAYYLSDKKQHTMVYVKNQHIDMVVTENHRCLFQNRKTKEFKVVEAKDASWTDSKIIHSGFLDKKTKIISDDQLCFIIAVQADGSFSKCNSIDFGFIKQRKADRLITICTKLGLKLKQINSIRRKRFSVKRPDWLSTYLDESKLFKEQLLRDLSADQMRLATYEQSFWDGLSTRKSREYVSKHESNVDFFQVCAVLTGQRAHKYTSRVHDTTYYRLSFTERNYSLTTNSKVEKKQEITNVWCVKVPSSFIVCRRGADTFVTGNCQQVPGHLHSLFVARPGYSLACFDESGIEARLIAYYSEDPVLCDLVINDQDIHGFHANIFFNKEWDLATIKKQHPAERQLAKNVGFGLFYGAGPNRIKQEAMRMGYSWDDAHCKKLYRAFRNTYKEVFEYKEQLDLDALDSPVGSLSGRVHSFTSTPDEIYMKCFNTLIQGSASDLVIMSAYKAQQEYRKLGIDAQFLIAVHDELVFEIANKDKNRAVEILIKSMTDYKLSTRHGDIPLKVEGKVGRQWSK